VVVVVGASVVVDVVLVVEVVDVVEVVLVVDVVLVVVVVGAQSGQSLATVQVSLQSYSPNNPPSGELTKIILPPLIQCFLLLPGVKLGDCSVPSQFVTV
jgi:hypothetical protein